MSKGTPQPVADRCLDCGAPLAVGRRGRRPLRCPACAAARKRAQMREVRRRGYYRQKAARQRVLEGGAVVTTRGHCSGYAGSPRMAAGRW